MMKAIATLVLFSTAHFACAQSIIPLAGGAEPTTLLEMVDKERVGIQGLQAIQGLFDTQVQSPTNLESLPYESVTHRLISKDIAIKLGYLTAGIEAQTYTAVLVSSWKKYAKVNIPMRENEDRGGQPTSRIAHVGCSIQFEMKLKGIDINASLGSVIRRLSASGSFAKYDVDIAVHIVGFSSPDVTAALPSVDFLMKLDNLKELSQTFRNVKGQVWSSQGRTPPGVNPQLIAIDERLVPKT